MTNTNLNIAFQPFPRNGNFRDITGQRFHRLVVVGYCGAGRWLCDCDCGGTATTVTNRLRRGHTRSCGCLQIERAQTVNTRHGQSGTLLYKVWGEMLRRCSNPADTHYAEYGGRGITVCERWKNFENFFADMGERPSKSHSIERRDNDLGYTPENCYWATKKQQARNRRSSVWLTFNGKTQLLIDWCAEVHLSYSCLSTRLYSGWSVENMLTTPARPRGR